MDKTPMLNRRKFISRSTQALALIPLVTVSEGQVWAAERITLDHPTASALGYVHDALKTDTTRFPKRSGPEGAKQFSSNCSQYIETEEGWGTCAIFPNYLVAGPGWCNVWVPIL